MCVCRKDDRKFFSINGVPVLVCVCFISRGVLVAATTVLGFLEVNRSRSKAAFSCLFSPLSTPLTPSPKLADDTWEPSIRSGCNQRKARVVPAVIYEVPPPALLLLWETQI